MQFQEPTKLSSLLPKAVLIQLLGFQNVIHWEADKNSKKQSSKIKLTLNRHETCCEQSLIIRQQTNRLTTMIKNE